VPVAEHATTIRVSVGTPEEMKKFQEACVKSFA
jgi:hypothetical protein